MRTKLFALLLPLVVLAWVAAGEQKPRGPGEFVAWIDDEHWLAADAGQLRLVHALTGNEKEFPGFEADAISRKGISAADRERIIERAEEIIANQQALAEGEFPVLNYPLPGPSPFQVVNQRATGKDLSAPSPDGKWTAVNRKNDMYFVEKDSGKEVRITKDGRDLIFNGRADAVYQEEIFFPGRSLNAFWWSPDSKHLAFFRLDDTEVPKFTIINHTERLQKPEITTYPKAGQPNPILKIGVAHVADGSVTWADLGKYDPKDLLAGRTVGFSPDNKEVYFYAQNRSQTWLDLCFADVQTGKVKVLFRDQTKAWIRDNGVVGPIKFQKDGTFLWNSERSGFKQVYRYTMDGQLKNAVGEGKWDVQKVHHVDEASGWVYFSANKDNQFGSHAYRVKLDGTGLEPLSVDGPAATAGTHEVHFSPNAKYFVDQWSAYATPRRVTLHQANGKLIRTVEAAPAEQDVKQGNQPQGGFFKIKTEDEKVFLSAIVQFPPNVDPAKKYPVWLSLYGGPHMPQVSDAGGKGGGKGGGDPKTNQGYITFRMDPRSASSTPHLSWACYKQLGVQELKDVETSLKWLIETYPCVDAKRIGISGHSYGGFMAAYALTHSKMFAAGIAGAPPTDWRNYNSIYVDRYMTTPDENPKGYEAGSVVAAAKNLHGRLLLLHGMMDDNVHMTSTIQLVDALQKANLDFDVMLYPLARHGIGGAHYSRLQNDFMKKWLQP